MIDIKNVTPTTDLVIVKLSNIEATVDGLMAQDHSDETAVAARYGEVISIGPLVGQELHCPGLLINDEVIFTEYAGYYIATTDTDSIYKILRGYDIIGKHMKEDNILNKPTTIPTGNRVLVELIDFTNTKDGIIYNASDPKLSDLSYGKILKVNHLINKLELSEGQLVAFAPYVGTFIQNYESEDKKALKIIVEENILFTV